MSRLRTPPTVQVDTKKIVEYAVMGLTASQIAVACSISVPFIEKILPSLENEIAEEKSKRLQKINRLIRSR